MTEPSVRANRLAEAANAAASGKIEVLEGALTEMEPSAEEIAQAIRVCFVRLTSHAASRDMLAIQLQVALAKEQIAAQKDMTEAANKLGTASFVLGAATLLVTLFALVLTLMKGA
jgi:hypothetical protein